MITRTRLHVYIKITESMDAAYKITHINSGRQSLRAYLLKTRSFAPMTLTLARRTLQINYAQTLLGVLWAVVQPLTGLLIFSLFFNKLIGIKTYGIPYPLFAFTGMVSWFFFSHIVQGAGRALLESEHLIKRIYFPRIILLLAKVLAAFAELAISLALLAGLLLLMGRLPGWPLLLLPVFILFNIATGLALAIWLSALTVRYRDFHHIIPYLVNFGIWLTPVFYPDTLVPAHYHWFLYLNPMATCMAGFRWCLAGGPPPEAGYLLSCIPVLLLLVTGLDYFRKVETEISDYI